MKQKKMVWYILVGVNMCFLVLLGAQFFKRQQLQQGIAEKVLRFHVRAHSDTVYDQELKLKVRDAVGAQMAGLLADVKNRAECERIVEAQLSAIVQTAESVIREEGYAYEAEAFLREADFPVKSYGAYTFPAGTYRALEVVIGGGEGHNWWCVMYPNMCFAGSVYEVSETDADADAALREVLSQEEYEKVLSSGDYTVRFKHLTFLNALTNAE